jgi:hypothetical protein
VSLSVNGQGKSSSLPKDQLPEPFTAIVTDNPKRVIYWNDRYNAIPEINKEIRSVSLCDSCVYLSTKDQRITNPQSIRVRDHYKKNRLPEVKRAHLQLRIISKNSSVINRQYLVLTRATKNKPILAGGGQPASSAGRSAGDRNEP